MQEKSVTKLTSSFSLVRKRVSSSPPRVVDNKKEHLEKPLSAAKRDEVLLRSAKEELDLSRQFMQEMKESQNALSTMGKSVPASLESLGNGISNGLTMLAMAMNPKVMQQYQMQNQGSDGSFPSYTPLQ